MEPINEASATIDDDYVRSKIEEAYVDAGVEGFQPIDMAAIKAELNRRLSAKPQREI
jgi:hypothetical protein